MPGELTRRKEKVSTYPGTETHGKEKGRGLDFPSDFARGKEKIFVSTCPGNRPAGRRRSGGLLRQKTLLKYLAGKKN